jgi:hypothetical protein
MGDTKNVTDREEGIKVSTFQIRDVDYDAGMRLDEAATAADALVAFMLERVEADLRRTVVVSEDGVAHVSHCGRNFSAVPVE